MTSLFDQLTHAAAADWQDYTDHAFIQQMEAGTLPREAFRQYLIQDYHFLVQFGRAYALAAYKARDIEEIRAAHQGLGNILHETDQHVNRLAAGWEMDRNSIHLVPEHSSNVAYTRFVLDAGMSGDQLDLQVALAPCVVGYAQIGQRLAPALEKDPQHPYAEWIQEYSSDWYQQTAAEAVASMDALAERSYTPARLPELVRIFSTATRMESAFWQMGLDLAAESS